MSSSKTSAAVRSASVRPRVARSWADVARALKPQAPAAAIGDADSSQLLQPELAEAQNQEEHKVQEKVQQQVQQQVPLPQKQVQVQEPHEEAQEERPHEPPQVEPSSLETSAADTGREREPGPRGSRRVLCHGEVLVMLGYYGWLSSADPIDHPDTRRNGGRIYVSRSDVVCGTELSAGDHVVFYVYVDGRGLGAEDVRFQSADEESGGECRPRERVGLRRSRSCAATARFRSAPLSLKREPEPPTGLRFGSAEFVPGAELPSMRAEAAVFVPTGCQAQAHGLAAPALSAAAAEFVPCLPAFAATETIAPPAAVAASKFNFVAINAAYFSDDSDDEESDTEGPLGTKHTSSSTGSSSTGAPSDSEDSEEFLEPPPGLPLPPGLGVPMRSNKLLAGIRPPPGLSLA